MEEKLPPEETRVKPETNVLRCEGERGCCKKPMKEEVKQEEGTPSQKNASPVDNSRKQRGLEEPGRMWASCI